MNYLFRMLIPAFPYFNVYSHFAKKTTALGPVCVATAAGGLESWDVEVIDENNCRNRRCPKDRYGYPDHEKLQKMRPADAAGFYGSLSSTAPRLYKLASLYKKLGVRTVAGGKHIENLPEEALAHDLDVVAFGDGEETIKELLLYWQKAADFENGRGLEKIAGIAFLKDGKIVKTPERQPITAFDGQPNPDFDLLRYAKIRYYPIGRIRGCNMNCEFCAVKDKTRCASPRIIIKQITYLAENRKARKFFEVSDHFGADRKEAIEFCRLLADYQKKSGIRITMTVQTRINDARDAELLQAMRDAGINNIAIGYESPLDEELIAMRKGYLSSDMLQWTRILHRFGFFIHGMFMFGYPRKGRTGQVLSLEEKIKRFRDFIWEAKIDTVQVLLTVPLPGTDLRKRLELEGRIYPVDQIGWEYYDGQFPLYEPDDGISPEELQKAVEKIVSRIYRFRSFLKMLLSTLIHFPRMVIVASFTIFTFRVKYIIQAYRVWKAQYFRNPFLRFGGYIIMKRWLKKFKKDRFLEYLKRAKSFLKKVKKDKGKGG